MQSEAEILSAIQPLVAEQMGLELAFPCHEDGGDLEPFVWRRTEQEFSAWNLLRAQGWVRSVEMGELLQLWQAPEIGAVNGDKSLIPENDPAGILLPEPERAERASLYAQIGQLLESRLQNLQPYELSCDSDYRLGIVIGQVEESGFWLGVGARVPIATPASSSPLQTVAPAATVPSDESFPATVRQSQELLSRLAPLPIYGYYGGGYNQIHEHQLLQVVAASPEQALTTLLQQVGLFSLSQFEAFVPAASGQDEQFEALTAFLRRTFSTLWAYHFSFWTWEQVFILGEQAGEWGGLILRSRFTYNP